MYLFFVLRFSNFNYVLKLYTVVTLPYIAPLNGEGMSERMADWKVEWMKDESFSLHPCTIHNFVDVGWHRVVWAGIQTQIDIKMSWPSSNSF